MIAGFIRHLSLHGLLNQICARLLGGRTWKVFLRPHEPGIYPLILGQPFVGAFHDGSGVEVSIPQNQHCTSFSVSVARQRDHDAKSHLRSEEHTSELQSRGHLVCRLLLEKKKKKTIRE